MSDQEMTVIEFATKHCGEHENVTAEALDEHVNAIIFGALVRNRALWRVGIDEEGRASLIWVSLPEFVWEHLLSEGIQASELMAIIGGIL